MRRLLIAGCGYTGVAAADLFHEAGWRVEGWTRSADSAAALSAKPYRIRAVDISRIEEVAGTKCDEFDAVIHCASTRGGGPELYRQVYGQGAENLLSRFPSSHFLFTSSTSVYAQKDESWVTEREPAEPEPESGRILRDTEQPVLEGRGTVVRLGGIYGPGRAALLQKFLKGEALLDPQTDRFVNQVHRDDVARALFFLLQRPASRGEIYNLVDNEPIRQSQCYGWLAARLHRAMPARGDRRSPGKRGQTNKRVSNAKLRALGWEPIFPTFADAMDKSVLPSFGL